MAQKEVEQVIIKVMCKTETNGPWSAVDIKLDKEDFEIMKTTSYTKEGKAEVKKRLTYLVNTKLLGQELLDIDFRF
jgi:hypothetical protein